MRFKRWHLILLSCVVVLLGAKYFLLDTSSAPQAPYVIDVEALHRAATAGGPLPRSIEVERIADFAFPRTMVVAGDGFRMHPMVLLSHRVVWPDQSSLIIDAAM